MSTPHYFNLPLILSVTHIDIYVYIAWVVGWSPGRRWELLVRYMAENPSDAKAQMACLVQICRSLAIAGKQYVKLAQRVQF